MYRKGTRVKGRGFSLIIMPNELSYSRLGVSIHRRVRGSVVRNRIKRIVRESFRLHRDVFSGSSDIVFAVRPSFSLQSPASVTETVKDLNPMDSGAGVRARNGQHGKESELQ